MRYILASTSPRRQELFKLVVSNFEICPSNADESLLLYFSNREIELILRNEPQQIVKKLAEIKAIAIAKEMEEKPKASTDIENNGDSESTVVVGSDTGVFFENQMLNKPIDKADALRMLKMLSGKTHKVITGVCCVKLVNSKITKMSSDFESTDVVFNELSDTLLCDYVESGLCFGKAGGYGIQDGFPLVKSFVGSYENVMGFPIELVRQMINVI